MCTGVVLRDVFKYYGLVLVTQRDENLDRPASAPQAWNDCPGMFGPKDLLRGGTWQGVNRRVAAFLTNRRDVKSYCLALHGVEMESRGEIVPFALEHARTAEEAFDRVMKLDGSRYNGFNFVVADERETYLIEGEGRDGEMMSGRRIDDEFFVVTNEGVGPDHSARAKKIVRTFEKIRKSGGPPTPGALAPMLNIHDDLNYTFKADQRCGSCINRLEERYGSRSSAMIRLQERAGMRFWEYWHRERPSPDAHVCGGAWVKQPDIEIATP